LVEEKERRRQTKLEKLKYFHSMDAADDPDGNRRFLRTRTVPPPAAIQEKVISENISSSTKVSSMQEGGISVTMEETTSTSAVAITSASIPAPQHPINMEGILQEPLINDGDHGTPGDPMLGVVPNPDTLEEDEDNDEQLPRKRRRNQVDYKQLFEQMKKENAFSG